MAVTFTVRAGKFNGRFTAFRTAVTKKYLARKRQADNFLGQLGLVWMIKIIRDMDQCADLVTHRGHHLRMTVPDIINPPAREEIEILLARYIHERHPLALDENRRHAGIGREDIFVVSFENLCFFHIVVRISYLASRLLLRATRYEILFFYNLRPDTSIRED